MAEEEERLWRGGRRAEACERYGCGSVDKGGRGGVGGHKGKPTKKSAGARAARQARRYAPAPRAEGFIKNFLIWKLFLKNMECICTNYILLIEKMKKKMKTGNRTSKSSKSFEEFEQ